MVLSKLMAGDVASLITECGIAHLPECVPGMATITFASNLGRVLQVAGVAEVQVLRPRQLEHAPPNIYSGNYGMAEFPLHTDLAHWYVPPRYLLLRCIIGAADVATRVLDGKGIVNAVGADVLARALVQPRRPVGGRRPLLHLLERVSVETTLVRWDRLFTVPATTMSNEVFAAVASFLDSSTADEFVLAHPGDTIIIDNWRMLHGRASVPMTSASRHIERVYLGAVHEAQ